MTVRRIPLPTWVLTCIFALLLGQAEAHPMPTTTVQLDLAPSSVTAQVALPFNDLQLATGWKLLGNPDALKTYSPSLRTYLQKHLSVTSPFGQPWTVQVGTPSETEAEQTLTGPYQEFVVPVQLTPPAGVSTRTFTLTYDAIVHQVVTHTVLVSVRQDWEQGRLSTPPVQVGVIETDVRTGQVIPLEINQQTGSAWNGFVGMFKLGMHHIAEGTDHLLFLLTLLLPAPLLAVMHRPPRWGPYVGTRRSLRRILQITLAFTVGHSLTLLLGSLAWIRVPDRPIEVLIALSILVSAVHALRPMFPGREVGVAGGFGLIHGLAFSFTLTELNLSPGPLVLSLLGFNLGIEVMQVLVIAVTLPWLLLLARTPWYGPVRMGGAALAALAALGWLGDRLGLANPLGTLADRLGLFGPWALLGLAALAVLGFVLSKPTKMAKPLTGSSPPDH